MAESRMCKCLILRKWRIPGTKINSCKKYLSKKEVKDYSNSVSYQNTTKVIYLNRSILFLNTTEDKKLQANCGNCK